MVLGLAFLLAVAFALVPATASGAAVDEGAGALWAPPIVPDEPNWPDSNSVELGVRFVTAEDTWITGVRFYKGDLNTGTHFGTLGNANGDLLATGEFGDETAEGWPDLKVRCCGRDRARPGLRRVVLGPQRVLRRRERLFLRPGSLFGTDHRLAGSGRGWQWRLQLQRNQHLSRLQLPQHQLLGDPAVGNQRAAFGCCGSRHEW
jgi:hypothetical protein